MCHDGHPTSHIYFLNLPLTDRQGPPVLQGKLAQKKKLKLLGMH